MRRLMMTMALLVLAAGAGLAGDWRGYGGFEVRGYARAYACYDYYGYRVPCYRPGPYSGYYAPRPRYYAAPRWRGGYSAPRYRYFDRRGGRWGRR